MGFVGVWNLVAAVLTFWGAWRNRHRRNLLAGYVAGGVLFLLLGVTDVLGVSFDEFVPVGVVLLLAFVGFLLRARQTGETREARAEAWAGFWDWFERI
jgi:CHASE2 domain-containing sensor protein